MNQPEPQCKVITGYQGRVNTEILPESDALNITPEEYDMYINRLSMQTQIKLSNGKENSFNEPIQKVEGKPLGLLRKQIMRPGRFLAPYDIGKIGECDESFFIKDNIIAYVARLRKHLFSGDGHKFIQTATKPYRIAFSSDISFCWIEPYYEDKGQE